jgi:hypothetical protein
MATTNTNEDPLAPPAEAVTLPSSEEESGDAQQPAHPPRTYDTPEEMMEILSQRHVVDLTAEDMDPLEWTFRKLIPVPENYYWDVVQDQDVERVPTRIKLWHKSFHSVATAFQWTEQRVGMPLARTLGLTSSRMSTVTMFMTDEDWKKSKRIVTERQQSSRPTLETTDSPVVVVAPENAQV